MGFIHGEERRECSEIEIVQVLAPDLPLSQAISLENV